MDFHRSILGQCAASLESTSIELQATILDLGRAWSKRPGGLPSADWTSARQDPTVAARDSTSGRVQGGRHERPDQPQITPHTRVTSAGLSHLKGLKGLKELTLHNVKFSSAILEELRRTSPKLKLHD
jgi:hypothetical protein